jgi:hypothetical protein
MRFLFLFIFFSLSVTAQTSYLHPARTLYEDGYEIFLGADYFETAKVISSEGTTRDLNEFESYRRLQFDFGGSFGLTQNLQFGLGGRFRNHFASIEEPSGEGLDLVSSGLQSLFFNLKYSFKPIDKLRYAFEATYRYTPYVNEEVTSGNLGSDLTLGDDGNEYSIGLISSYELGSANFLSGRLDYRRPGGDLSSEVFYRAEGALTWTYFALVGGVEGIYSLNNDPYNLNDRPNFSNGPSSLYNSQNRQSYGAYGGVNFSFGPQWRVELKATQIIGGRSTDLGMGYMIQLTRRVETPPKSRLDSNFKTYDIEANITKVSSKKDLVQIDKGLEDDLRKGMIMDFFEFDFFGGNILIARGVIISTKSDSSVVKITQRFHKSKSIKEGLVGRSSLK